MLQEEKEEEEEEVAIIEKDHHSSRHSLATIWSVSRHLMWT